MGYNDVITVATGDPWSAADHNTYIRDNFAAGVPAIFQVKGDIAYGTGSKAAARLAIGAENAVLRSVSGVPSWGVINNPHAKLIKDNWDLANNSTYTVQWSGEELDSNGFANLGVNNTRLTIPTGFDGNYLVVCEFQTPNGSSGDRTITLLLNGSAVGSSVSKDAVSNYTELLVLSAGNYLEMSVKQITGDVATSRTYISLLKV